jgi:hypothetical protein
MVPVLVVLMMNQLSSLLRVCCAVRSALVCTACTALHARGGGMEHGHVRAIGGPSVDLPTLCGRMCARVRCCAVLVFCSVRQCSVECVPA